jgi:ABC-type Mn/Zn transport systems, ATPase component
MAKLLEVKNLSVSYDKVPIITNISFDVAQHDVFVILGPNGAGKTTLLRAMLGLIPYEGSITWQTKNISYLPPQEFLSRHNLLPLTVEEFFSFKTKNRDLMISMLHNVDLNSKLLHQQFNTLSTGQFQRMLIAWALINNPDV